MKIPLPVALLFLVPLALRGEVTNVIDIAAWTALSSGETNGWTIAGIGHYTDGTVQFNAKDDFATSPYFPLPIIRVEAMLKCSQNATRFLSLAPLPATDDSLVRVASQCDRSDRTSLQTFDWTADDDVHQFTIAFNSAATGSLSVWGIGALSVICDDSILPAPTDLATAATNCNAFTAFWTNPENAAANTLCVSQRVVTAATYEKLQGWDFSSVTNTSKSSSSYDAAIADAFPGLSGKGLQLAANTNGYIQIGKSTMLGELVISNVDVHAAGVLFHAAQYNNAGNDYGSSMPVFMRTARGNTNLIDVVELDESARDFYLPLPTARETTDVLVLHSTTNHMFAKEKIASTVNLYSVALVTNYVPAATNTVCRRTERFSARDHYLVRDLTPGTYAWFVTAEAADGTASKPSALQEVTLAPDLPRWIAPGLFLRIR